MARNDHDATRFAYAVSGKCTQTATLDAALQGLAGEKGICIIENASPDVVQTLQHSYGLPAALVAAHAANSSVLEAWKNRSSNCDQPLDEVWASIQGLYIQTGLSGGPLVPKKVRRSYWPRSTDDERDTHPAGRYTNTTRISYYTDERRGWWFFLVDANETYFRPEYSGRVRVRFPAFSSFSGGLQLLLHGNDDNIFDAFLDCFRHLWTNNLVLELTLERRGWLRPATFTYMLVTSINDDRLTALRHQIRHISFHAIRDQSISINDSLHDAREELATLKDAITETSKYAVGYTDLDYSTSIQELQRRIENLAVSAEDLHKFFTETIQLIAQMVTIRDAQNSAKQAQESFKQTAESLKQTKQAMLLTGLAAVYLPLSLATGLFGMNLREINDSSPRLWMFIVTLFVLILLTIAGLGIVLLIQKRSERPTKSEKEKEKNLSSIVQPA